MANSPWIDIALQQPLDGQLVYVRRIGVEAPYDAVYVHASASFTLANGLNLAWEFVSKWRPRP